MLTALLQMGEENSMKAHELARKLLDGPDLDVVYGIHQTGYGQEILETDPVEAENIEGDTIKVIDLIVSMESLVAVGGF